MPPSGINRSLQAVSGLSGSLRLYPLKSASAEFETLGTFVSISVHGRLQADSVSPESSRRSVNANDAIPRSVIARRHTDDTGLAVRGVFSCDVSSCSTNRPQPHWRGYLYHHTPEMLDAPPYTDAVLLGPRCSRGRWQMLRHSLAT